MGTSSKLEQAQALATKIASGELGPATKTAFSGLFLAFDSARATSTKEAVADDSAHESDNEARKRRLAELLRRREHSGLNSGSATPTPPRDNA